MQTTGRVTGVVRDIETGKLIVSFIIDSPTLDISGGDTLDITAKVHKDKRSLAANAYFHKLVELIATAAGASNIEIKNRLIREYGAYMYIDGRIPTMTLKAEYENEALVMEGLHLQTIERDGETVRMAMMRGSSTYNTAEMSRLIDGAVSEAKEMGIETLPPKELERMKATWNTGQKPV